MNEKDIKAILWLFEEINEDKIIASYFRQELNLRKTDIAKLIGQFKDFVRMLDKPMTGDLSITMIPNIIVKKGNK